LTASARTALLLALCASAWSPWGACQAAALRFCDRPAALSAGQQDTLFRFGAIVKEALDASGQGVALIARSGLDLSRFGMRYSHAGFSLKASPNSPWSVRQLYYACDEQKPRIYDQGLAGFLLGSDAPDIGYLSIVFVPAEAAAELERAALDDRQALALLGPAYSANAYPFSLRYQNCNQWVMELLAAAWGRRGGAADAEPARADAQGWLADQGYVPSVVDVGYRPLMWASAFIPLLHNDDTPMRVLELMAERKRAEADGVKPAALAVNTSGLVAVLEKYKVVLFFTGHDHAGKNLASRTDAARWSTSPNNSPRLPAASSKTWPRSTSTTPSAVRSSSRLSSGWPSTRNIANPSWTSYIAGRARNSTSVWSSPTPAWARRCVT